MGNKKYVAYVGTYTYGTSKGIQVYDVDVENGKLIERSEVNVSNASHTAVSKNGKYLYSIEDEVLRYSNVTRTETLFELTV
mgnify:FL=1